jgi:hypothetical protein
MDTGTGVDGDVDILEGDGDVDILEDDEGMVVDTDDRVDIVGGNNDTVFTTLA